MMFIWPGDGAYTKLCALTTGINIENRLKIENLYVQNRFY